MRGRGRVAGRDQVTVLVPVSMRVPIVAVVGSVSGEKGLQGDGVVDVIVLLNSLR